MNKLKQETYNHKSIEPKWQKIWEERKLYQPDLDKVDRPFYNLMMWPYPSAEGLHVGNMYAFTGADIYGRLKQMQGFDVFEPIGFDSGGLHSENYAIKVKRHPKQVIKENVGNFAKQLHKIGAMYDWSRSADAMDPDYYRWTQWIFIQLFKGGLAYKKKAPVTWCPSCKTTVSDEQTEKRGEITVCERCKTEIERKKMDQWFFRITKYAEKLLENTKKLNWPEKILTAQKNWIGKSRGAKIRFMIYDLRLKNKKIKVFTTRPDTLYGCTFFCLAPEHFLVDQITSKDNKKAVSNYIAQALNKTEQERKAENKEKTGVFTGSYVMNPVSGKKVPIYVADYVLLDYGEGAVMGVPAHDQRDWQFAKKYNLPILPVVKGKQWQVDLKDWQDKYAGQGTIINSRDWNNWNYPKDMDKVINWLEKKKIGQRKTTYKLRDWCISRQRYWGPPIPMIYCPECARRGKSWFTQENSKKFENWDLKIDNSGHMAGWYPVPEKDLPVLLPEIDDYEPDGSGKAPLAKHPEFYETTCPKCDSKAKRETDVSDTFLDSSWYFLRYPSIGAENSNGICDLEFPWNREITRRWLPVDQYTGGAEHSVLHLMYSRFITMALHNLGYLDFSEPFPNFYAHGLLIKDGAKMSKSRGNVINPDQYIDQYGADTLRMYLMFMGPFSAGGDFRDSGIKGMYKFVKKLYNLTTKAIGNNQAVEDEELEIELECLTEKMTNDLGRFKYNTAIAKLMEFVNVWNGKIDKSGSSTKGRSSSGRKIAERIAILLAPLTPHLAEEIYQQIQEEKDKGKGKNWSVHQQPWPKADEKRVRKDKITIVVQINGKLREKLEVKAREAKKKDGIISLAQASERIQKFLKGKKIKKTIFVPKRLVNFVV